MKKKFTFHNPQFIRGMSLLEVLVAITVFAVLGILITQSVVLTLQGSRKSESVVRARENLDYVLSVIEHQIRSASSVYSDAAYTTPCSASGLKAIYYKDQNGQPGSFSCIGLPADNSYIASGSANLRLTSDTVKVEACSFTCTPPSATNPALITVDITLKEILTSGIQSANVSASTQIYLRNY